MKLLFVISDLQLGGAQRVATILCNTWAESGHDVHLVTFAPPEELPYYSLDSRVSLTQLGFPGRDRRPLLILSTNIRRISALRNTIQRISPDAAVAFMPEANVVTLLASTGFPGPVFVSERIDPASLSLGWLRESARGLVYPRAAAVVVQTPAIGDYVARRFRAKPIVVSNPVSLDQFRQAARRDAAARRRIVGAGRLERQKGFDLLIEAFDGLAQEMKTWDVCIYGDGPERESLQSRIRELNLTDRISLPGVCHDMPAAYASADFLVHPSRFEGLSNVIMEAMAAGLPVIATDCPGGSASMLGNGQYGRLVPVDDVPSLRREMAQLMTNENMRRSLSKAGHEAVQKYDAPIVAARWIELISQSVRNARA